MIEDLDKAFAKYRGLPTLGQNMKLLKPERETEQRKKIREQEIERFK